MLADGELTLRWLRFVASANYRQLHIRHVPPGATIAHRTVAQQQALTLIRDLPMPAEEIRLSAAAGRLRFPGSSER
jgi:hypothetical protein